MRTYEYRHIVTFEETSVVGTVYYANHVRWQGRCRELFLREHAPGILEAMREGLRLVTTRCSCEYFAELFGMDEVIIRMSLTDLVQNRISTEFTYHRGEELVARGEQQVASMLVEGDGLIAIPVPEELQKALEPFGAEKFARAEPGDPVEG